MRVKSCQTFDHFQAKCRVRFVVDHEDVNKGWRVEAADTRAEMAFGFEHVWSGPKRIIGSTPDGRNCMVCHMVENSYYGTWSKLKSPVRHLIDMSPLLCHLIEGSISLFSVRPRRTTQFNVNRVYTEDISLKVKDGTAFKISHIISTHTYAQEHVDVLSFPMHYLLLPAWKMSNAWCIKLSKYFTKNCEWVCEDWHKY